MANPIRIYCDDPDYSQTWIDIDGRWTLADQRRMVEVADDDFWAFLRGKTVALYGLGDQEKYGGEFVDALLTLHDAVVACGARVIGAWPAAGYEFKASRALIDGRFVGLALDQVNQAGLTEARIRAWLLDLASNW